MTRAEIAKKEKEDAKKAQAAEVARQKNISGNPDRIEDSADDMHLSHGLKRPSRATLGVKNKLLAPQRPGWIRRWINDVPGRLEEALSMGYRVVTGKVKGTADKQAALDSSLGSVEARSVGGGRTGILVETPVDLYRAGLKEKEQGRKELESDLLLPGKDRDVEGAKGYGEVQVDRPEQEQKK